MSQEKDAIFMPKLMKSGSYRKYTRSLNVKSAKIKSKVGHNRTGQNPLIIR